MLAACGAPTREAPAPPPITASAPSPSPAPSETPGAIATPETERAAAAERVIEPSLPITPVATGAPQATPDPAVPPPAPLPDLSSLPPPPAPDPLRAMQDAQARKFDYERRLERLKAEVEDARTLAARREKDLLAFKNPFLPRPQLPPDEAQAIAGMDGAARVKWADDRLTAAKVALGAAQKAYDDAKANPPLN
jgi:hypothetical protein